MICYIISLLFCFIFLELFFFFFFFQAEDGIRDYKVTGVQTCALPICLRTCNKTSFRAGRWRRSAAPLPRETRARRPETRRPIGEGADRRSRGGCAPRITMRSNFAARRPPSPCWTRRHRPD